MKRLFDNLSGNQDTTQRNLKSRPQIRAEEQTITEQALKSLPPSVVKPVSFPPTYYYGDRVNSKGKKTKDFVAGRAVQDMYAGEMLPIFETYEDIHLDGLSEYKKKKELLNKDPSAADKFKQDLESLDSDSIDSYDESKFDVEDDLAPKEDFDTAVPFYLKQLLKDEFEDFQNDTTWEWDVFVDGMEPQLQVQPDGTQEWVPVYVKKKPPQLVAGLREAAELAEQTKDYSSCPLIFLVTSTVHAIIYIFHEAKLYTVGYGYRGYSSSFPEENRISTKLQSYEGNNSVLDAVIGPLAHTIETLPGALYTADYLAPTENMTAAVSWVGFMTPDIAARMQNILDNTQKIIITGTYLPETDEIFVSNQAEVVLSNKYMEAVGFLPKQNTYNCLIWAQKMLDIRIDCGMLNRPSNCRPLSVAQFNEVKQNMGTPRLADIVKRIQADIEISAESCRLANGLCWWGGKRRTRRAKRRTTHRKRRHVGGRRLRHSQRR